MNRGGIFKTFMEPRNRFQGIDSASFDLSNLRNKQNSLRFDLYKVQNKQDSLRFDLYKFWNKQVPFASISKTKPRSKLRSAFVSISLTLLVRYLLRKCVCPRIQRSEFKGRWMLLISWTMYGFQEQFLQEQKLQKFVKIFKNRINANNIFLLCICTCPRIHLKYD